MEESGGLKKYLRRVYLIPVFNVFAVLSVLIGIGLLSYFLYIFQTYFSGISENEVTISIVVQTVDFMGLLYGSIWILLGFFFHFIALRMQLVELKFKINHISETDPVIKDQIFETTFLNHTKKQLDILNSLFFEYDEPIESGSNKTRVHIVKGIEFFDYFRKTVEAVKIALQQQTYPESDKFKDINSKYILASLGITQGKFESILKGLHSNDPIEHLRQAYLYVYKFHHQNLNEYFHNLMRICLHIENAMHNEPGENPQKEIEIKEKYAKFSKFLVAHLSASELTIIYTHSLFHEDFMEIIRPHEFFTNFSEKHLIDGSSTSFLKNNTK